MSTSNKIVYNVAFSSVAKVLSTVAALVGIGFITRHLGQEGFGWYATALAFLPLFGALGDWGLPQTTAMRISKPGAEEKKIVSNAIGIRIILSLLILAVVPILVPALPYPIELKMAIVLVAFSYVFSSSYQVLIGLFQKRLKMDRVTGAELAGKVIQVILIIIGVQLNWSFYFIISTLLANMIINFLFIFLMSRKFIRFKPSFDFSYWKYFLKQSIPIGIGTALTFVYFRSNTILLSLLRPAEDVGIFGAAQKVIENISFFPAMIVGLTMPLFTYNLNKNRDKFKRIVNENYKIFFLLTIPMVVGGVLLADGIIHIIAGPEFQASVAVLQVVIFALALIFFGNLFINILIAADLQKYMFIALLICAIFNISTNLYFIPQFPDNAYMVPAVLSVITELLVVVLTGFFIFKKINFFPKVEKLPFMILAGLLMAGYLWILRDLHFFLLLATSPLVYFGGLLAFKVVSRDEIKSLALSARNKNKDFDQQ
ncbi:MAG: oligosaccharide flippase family protein [Candidatus Moranbacteria bacterium]|nr:oligosaccharide flippase family protein [Candidatus Moranbacteria bacterium]